MQKNEMHYWSMQVVILHILPEPTKQYQTNTFLFNHFISPV